MNLRQDTTRATRSRGAARRAAPLAGALAGVLAAAFAAAPAAAQDPVPTPSPADTVPGRAPADSLGRAPRLDARAAAARRGGHRAPPPAARRAGGQRDAVAVALALRHRRRVLVNGFVNSRGVNNADVPQFVRPDPQAGPRAGGIGGALRQTTLSGTAFVPRVLGGVFSGDVNVDFYGGQQASPGGRHFPCSACAPRAASSAGATPR
jgi:hypothetical protein